MPASSTKGKFNTANLFGGAEVEHYHQAVAVVVAETFEQARAAAALVRVDYARGQGASTSRQAPNAPPRGEAGERSAAPPVDRVGDFEAAFAAAPVTLDETYTTPDESHAMMEPHATIASWEGDKLTFWTSNQMIAWGKRDLAKTLGIPSRERPRSISPYHRRRLRRQAVPARRCGAGRAGRAGGRAPGQGRAARGR